MAFMITNECISCGICEHVCYFDAVSFHPGDEHYTIDSKKCMHCGECVDECPLLAIINIDPDRKRIKRVEINEEKCNACSLCQKKCPVDAISGTLKEGPFVINQGKCVHCGICIDACKKQNAVEVSYEFPVGLV